MTASVLPKPHAFERGDKLYIVSTLAPFGPAKEEIEEYAFSKELLAYAPNENLMWLKGPYAEGDRPNANNQMWLSEELALKHLTPRLMPVTVMHDPRTAVGLIADARLLTPENSDVPRPRIETSLAIWKHRFPDIAEESLVNYEQGTLMQSMECVAPHYSCSECGKTYPKLPGGAEEEFWCGHLSGQGGEGPTAARILGNVVFTGTGLIFGTRGSRGAYDEANLDVFHDEVAEFHAEAHRETRSSKPRSKTSMDNIEISKSEYAELQKRPSADDLVAAVKRAETAEATAAQATKDLEAAEAAKVAAETAKAEADTKLQEATEAANAARLSEDRLAKLGKGFKAKLGEKTTENLTEDSKSMSDEKWAARLEELSETVGVKHDEDATPEDQGAEEEFNAEEIASAGVGSEASAEQEPSSQARSSVFGGLMKTA